MRSLRILREKPTAQGQPRVRMAWHDVAGWPGQKTEKKTVPRDRDLLVCGPPQSGKTTSLCRMAQAVPLFWLDHQALLLRVSDPLGVWLDHETLQAFARQRGLDWRALNTQARIKLLYSWAESVPVVLLVYDAHKLNGRKQDVVQHLLRRASRMVLSAPSVQALPMSLRVICRHRPIHNLRLRSEAAFDSTATLLAIMSLLAILLGWWPLLASIGALHLLAGGRLAARQR